MNYKFTIKVIPLVITTLFVHFIGSVPALETHLTSNALTFLERFGYLTPPNPRSGYLMSEDSVSASIRQLQRFAGINVTGIIDKETETLIKTPRCGMADFGPADTAKRTRRYIHQGSTWKKKNLTWRYKDRNNDGLSDTNVRRVLAKALKKWSNVTTLNFQEITSGTPDIWFRFVRGAHQDPFPFDGLSGILAHAFYPSNNKGLSGDVHFDDDERYTIESADGKDLLWIAVHELGHSMGLKHSNVKGAIMYPWYQANLKGQDFSLTEDDVIGIQTLYGSRVQKEKSTSTPNPSTLPPKVTVKTHPIPSTLPPKVTVKPLLPRGCTKRIQAVFLGKDEKTYVINRNEVYVLGANLGIEKGPMAVDNYFKGLTLVDAVFTRHGDKKTVFFEGDEFYVFDGTKLVSGPRKINEGFSGVHAGLSNINAAFVWPRNDKLYIFAGYYYYRFSPKKNSIRNDYVIDTGYPRLIAQAWKGVPYYIDAVFTWRNGKTYFFKGSKYYRLNDKKIEVSYGYPQDIASTWMNCPGRLSSNDNGSSPGGSSVLQITMVTTFASIAALMKIL